MLLISNSKAQYEKLKAKGILGKGITTEAIKDLTEDIGTIKFIGSSSNAKTKPDVTVSPKSLKTHEENVFEWDHVYILK